MIDLAAVAGLAGVILTALVAPRIDRRWKQRSAERDAADAAKVSELDIIRAEQRELRESLNTQLQEARIREAEKDARIDVLEEKIRSLQMQVDMFRAGLAHPPGFILLPRNVWIGLRARLGDQLPPGPFVGEDEDTPGLPGE